MVTESAALKESMDLGILNIIGMKAKMTTDFYGFEYRLDLRE